MAGITTFRDLMVWQKAHELVLYIYRTTAAFPTEEKYGLVSQMRRAASSVAINIVEGFRRVSAKESIRFYDISNASLEELRYEAQLAFDLGYIVDKEFRVATQKLEEVSKMLNSWIRSQVRNSRSKSA